MKGGIFGFITSLNTDRVLQAASAKEVLMTCLRSLSARAQVLLDTHWKLRARMPATRATVA